MLERIKLILKSRNLSAAQFADEIGVQRSSVSHILTGRNNASLDFLLKVLARYPEIDTDWLLTGKGVMIRMVPSAVMDKLEAKGSKSPATTTEESYDEKGSDLMPPKTEGTLNKGAETKITDAIGTSSYNPNTFIASDQATMQKEAEEKINKTLSPRKIEKIVIFYSDMTFRDFEPEN
ncbi:MAG: helix-turn-helix transcriptional regulator [Bacteroidota bacterium]|nr:helix-turn-helix transcriptional regulator [Bacteroidota bacterium]